MIVTQRRTNILLLLIIIVAMQFTSCAMSGMPEIKSSDNLVESKSIKTSFHVQGGSSYPDSLAPMFPNPFNAVVGDTVININFTLRDSGDVKLIIQNPVGDSVIVFEDERLGPGSYSNAWAPVNSSNEPLRSGLYFITLRVSPDISERNYINSRLFLIEAN